MRRRLFRATTIFCLLIGGVHQAQAQGLGALRGALRGAVGGRYAQPRQATRAQQVQPQRSVQPTQKQKSAAANNAAPPRRALIVATRDYSESRQLPSLPGTNRDADLIAAALRRGGFGDKDVVLIYDDADTPRLRPTRASIQARFDEFLVQSKAGVAVVFLTGHGISRDGVSYYCPADANDQMLDDPDAARDGLISINDLATRFSKECKASSKLMVVDACRSDNRRQYSGLVETLSKLEEPAKDIWLMSSCSEGQRSWISSSIVEGERHPIFSYFVARGLEGTADLLGDNDGRVGLFELFTYAFVKTKAATEAFVDAEGQASRQTPELFGLAAPFEVATVGNLVARRTLTTGDVAAEASRSADQIADDMLVNLRLAEYYYRIDATADNTSDEAFAELSGSYHNYLCYLLGNRIDAALELDRDCKLAHVARGITYRASGTYDAALDGFVRGGESFDLFVKADEEAQKRRFAHDRQGKLVLDQNQHPVPRINKTDSPLSVGFVYLYDEPDGEKAYYVLRETKVSIDEIAGEEDNQWLRVNAINDHKTPGGWIRRADVHWLPEAIDVYTPQSVMRPFGASTFSAANRFDYAANNIYQLSDMLAQPARQLDQLATLLRGPSNALGNAAAQAGQVTDSINYPISVINSIGSYIGLGVPYVPNPVAGALSRASGWAAIPANHVSYGASMARIPSNYVSTAGGYVQTPSSYIRSVQGWSAHTRWYHAGNSRSLELEKKRKKLKDGGDLNPVEARPIEMSELPWLVIER